jgi:hypothetical protein
MVIKTEIDGDVFTTEHRHIVFALNIEGKNIRGFALDVVLEGFEEIKNTNGKNPFTNEELRYGEVISKEINGKTYHGIVCYSLQDGWGDNTYMHILKAFNELDVQEPMSVVDIGNFLMGERPGAPDKDIYLAFMNCNKKLRVYKNFFFCMS